MRKILTPLFIAFVLALLSSFAKPSNQTSQVIAASEIAAPLE